MTDRSELVMEARSELQKAIVRYYDTIGAGYPINWLLSAELANQQTETTGSPQLMTTAAIDQSFVATIGLANLAIDVLKS